MFSVYDFNLMFQLSTLVNASA